MRRIEMSLLGALATAAIGITVFGPAAQAQQPAQCEPTVFLPEGGILDGAAGEQAVLVRACAQGDVWLRVWRGDQLLSIQVGPLSPGGDPPVLDRVVDVRPCNLQGGSDLPGARHRVIRLRREARSKRGNGDDARAG